MLRKFFLALIFSFSFLALSGRSIFAVDRPTFVSIVNPVRGPEGWTAPKQTPLDLPRLQYINATPSAFPVTWLLRYDAVKDATTSAFFSTLTATDSSQFLGAFLEITPKLTAAANVVYPPGEYMMAANRIFLSGYSQEDRIRLIDAYMKDFYDRFGYYPKTVGAWHIDSFSLEYLQKHYSVLAAVICDEQYDTDNYRLWGGYIGSPYFPSRFNVLVPGQTPADKLNIAVTKWAPRDFFNFYGKGGSSWYSLQVNDFALLSLDERYFDDLLKVYSQKDFNEFTQINIGLENDYDIKQYGQAVKKTYQLLRERTSRYNLNFISLSNFGQWLDVRYTNTSPYFFYQSTDITGKNPGKIYWYQNPYYRIGLKVVNGRTQIVDLRLYNTKEAESYYLTQNTSRKLYLETPAVIDSTKYPGTAVDIPFDLTQTDLSMNYWRLNFVKGDQSLGLEPTRIVWHSVIAPEIKSDDIKVSRSGSDTIWNFAPHIPFGTNIQWTLILFILIICLIPIIWKKRTLGVGLLAGCFALITVIKSGLIFVYGMGFWGPNGHDAIFHLSLSEKFNLSLFNLDHPQFSGALLKNYHFAYDWISGLLLKLLHFNDLDLYFRIFPIIIIISLTLLSIKLMRSWHYSRGQVTLGVILIYLTGSFGFIPALLSGKNIFSGESVFWANQSISLLLNPPFALSLVGLLIFLLCLPENQKFSLKQFLFLSVFGGLLAQVKVYAWILLCLALLLSRSWKLMFGVGIAGVLFLLISLGHSQGLPFSFSPFWFTRSLFEASDRLPIPKLAQAWQTYEASGAIAKLFAVNLLALIVFLVGNLGVRLLGFFTQLKSNHPEKNSWLLVNYMTIFGLIIPLVFIQSVNPWNTIQFMYYSLFFLNLFTAFILIKWLGRFPYLLKITIIILFFFLALPTSVGTLRDYLTYKSAARISFTELHALDTLRGLPSGIVVSPLPQKGDYPDPVPLYGYVSTAYISAFSGQPEFLSDTINLDITGFDYGERAKEVQRLYLTHDPLWIKTFLQTNHISYIYEIIGRDELQIHPEDACLTRVFDSGEINIYKYHCL